MLADNTYSEWTKPFHEGSYYEGSWEEGSEIKFLGPDENGGIGGMFSRIKKNDKYKFLSIEHIGSTAIPNLAAKPIIDIDVVFDENTDFETIKRQLENIGYYHNGNQGIPDRDVFKRLKMSGKHAVLDGIVHHLYVCPIDSEELKKHILFRNYLITHEKERIQYQNMKFEIAEEAHQDHKKYAQLKEMKAQKFINDLIMKSSTDLP